MSNISIEAINIGNINVYYGAAPDEQGGFTFDLEGDEYEDLDVCHEAPREVSDEAEYGSDAFNCFIDKLGLPLSTSELEVVAELTAWELRRAIVDAGYQKKAKAFFEPLPTIKPVDGFIFG